MYIYTHTFAHACTHKYKHTHTHTQSTLEQLARSCDEFLVHGVDVEGMQLGIDDALVETLGR
jgi:phosphoribosylformimino-5-aminoimidazole carboxamide ribonucleotide (ProFAR) isomerase